MKDLVLTIKVSFLIFFVFILSSFSLAAMESSNYKIQADDINVSGNDSVSTNYKINDSLGQTGGGLSESSSYKLRAGYREMDEESATISINSPASITLTALSLTNDSAVGSTTWNISTNNSAGYTMTVKASASPALVSGGNSFADYTEGSAGVKETWAVSNAYEFGFSGLGSHTTGYGTDSQSNCAEATDVPSTTLLWEGFNGTTGIEIASSTSANSPGGTDSTLCVATEQHTVFAPSGTYSATITATATTL